MTPEALVSMALEEEFAGAEIVDTRKIVFDPAFRPYCAENLCGQYGVNAACPPDCGSPQEMKKRIQSYRQALVLQTIWEISDYADQNAVRKAKAAHNTSSIRLLKRARANGLDGFMVGAGACALCRPCSLKIGKPCPFPDLRYSCMSAYCIFVKKLADLCGLEYDCGPGLLGLFGMIVFDKRMPENQESENLGFLSESLT